MGRKMRREDKEISEEKAYDILRQAEYGVMSCVSETEHPYGVPLNFCLSDGNIYFHSAVEGHKVDNIKRNPRVSFCVVGETKLLPEKFSTDFESVIVFGRAREVSGAEKLEGLKGLIEKFSPDFISEGLEYIDDNLDRTKVFRITIDEISGKSSFK